jgi:hypothetical protein
VIGGRAIPRLSALIASDAAPPVRSAALGALDGVDDRRTIAIALGALASNDAGVVSAAIGVLRGWLTREPGTQVLEALTAVAVDPARDARVTRAALDALSDLPPELVRPILDRQPPHTAIAFDDPAAARAWVAARAGQAPLSELHDALARMGERERAEGAETARRAWCAARGAAHAALAGRGSRIALYDLKETFDTARGAVPLDFLSAITAIGDASCLEPLARAWAASPPDEWWRERLSGAAEAIVHRTRLSGRSAVMKRVRAKWAGFV